MPLLIVPTLRKQAPAKGDAQNCYLDNELRLTTVGGLRNSYLGNDLDNFVIKAE